MLFGPYWTKGKVANGLILAIRNNIVTKKTTELVLHFHKKTTKEAYDLHQKKITSTMINTDKYVDFMINANKNADSMFNTENF